MITIIVLLILSGITINMVLSDEGIMEKAQEAGEKNNVAVDEEKIKLKIVQWQMQGYTENKEFPNLQYIADRIAEDDDFDYLALEYETADKNKITLLADSDSIYTSLKDSPYIFEIDRSMKIASIDGKVKEYTLTYDANGGTNAPDPQFSTDKVIVTSSEPSKEGYLFLGWATISSATQKEYNAGDEIKLFLMHGYLKMVR